MTLELSRGEQAALVAIGQTLTELLAEVRHLRSALGATARSSIELAENAKGGVQVTTKAYVDCPGMDDAVTEAIAAFAIAKREVERGQMQQWRDTNDQLERP